MLSKDQRRERAEHWHHYILNNYSDVIEEQAKKTVIHDEIAAFEVPSGITTKFFVVDSFTNDSTITALQKNERTCVLNFASYCNPGGGFLNGATAQEETLCAQSTLYEVLIRQMQNFYEKNRTARNNSLYSNRRLFSPEITFFDQNQNPVGTANVITCAAPNFRAATHKGISSSICNNELKKRVEAVLNTAARSGCSTLILGAFGCGVFGNDPKIVSDAFFTLLQSDYKNVFEKVIFAIPGKGKINHDAFECTFHALI